MEETQEFSELDIERFERHFKEGLSLAYRLKMDALENMTFENQVECLTIWERKYSKENKGYLPSGTQTKTQTEELKLRQNAKALVLGKKIPHEEVKDLSIVDMEEVNERYKLFLQNPYKYREPAGTRQKKTWKTNERTTWGQKAERKKIQKK